MTFYTYIVCVLIHRSDILLEGPFFSWVALSPICPLSNLLFVVSVITLSYKVQGTEKVEDHHDHKEPNTDVVRLETETPV